VSDTSQGLSSLVTVVNIYETSDGRIRAAYRDTIFPSQLTIADALQCVVDHLQEQGC
jgi:hypothetical protein